MLKARNIHKSYPQGSGELKILKGIEIEIKAGEALSIVGASGSGKSTLLHILGTLDRPQSGEIFFKNEDILSYNDEQLAHFRNQKLGFIFQFHHLLPEFNVLENAMMPLLVSGEAKSSAQKKAKELLDYLGVGGRLEHFPSELSGGELQRTAIARALITKPELVLADEPTGNLDSENSRLVQDLLFSLQKELGIALVVVTHDMQFASRFSRLLKIQNGLLV